MDKGGKRGYIMGEGGEASFGQGKGEKTCASYRLLTRTRKVGRRENMPCREKSSATEEKKKKGVCSQGQKDCGASTIPRCRNPRKGKKNGWSKKSPHDRPIKVESKEPFTKKRGTLRQKDFFDLLEKKGNSKALPRWEAFGGGGGGGGGNQEGGKKDPKHVPLKKKKKIVNYHHEKRKRMRKRKMMNERIGFHGSFRKFCIRKNPLARKNQKFAKKKKCFFPSMGRGTGADKILKWKKKERF